MIETFSMVAPTAARPLLRSWSAAVSGRSAEISSPGPFFVTPEAGLLRLASGRGGPDRGPDGVLEPFQRELAVDAAAVHVELRGGVDAVPDALPHVLLDLRGVGGAGDLLAELVQVQPEVAGVPQQRVQVEDG